MENGKLTKGMSINDIIIAMSEGNPDAMQIVIQMMNNSQNFIKIVLCDRLGIRGTKLYMLYNNCCNRNDEKFKRTLMMLKCGIYSQDQIQENLSLFEAIPFIDDSIIIEGVPPYGENFNPTSKSWKEFCDKNKDAFTRKLNTVLDQQKNPKL